MNLGKLLGAGKTFFGGGGTVAYREDKRVYLPKFNAEKNPFTSKPAESAPVSAPAAAPEVKQVSVPVAAKTQKIPVFNAPPTKSPMPTRAISWKDKLNPFRTPEPVRPAMPGAVQVELSLEAVKVVHNDLADADIEVVPVKSRTAAAPETPMLAPARSSWEFLGERLVKQI
jgi:hypothetical protein